MCLDTSSRGLHANDADSSPQDEWASVYSRHVETAMAMMEKHLYPQLLDADAHLENIQTSASKLFYDVSICGCSLVRF